MAKLSHGADTWRSEGLRRKYKAQIDIHDEPKIKGKKKDTNKWCKGKVGRGHVFRRYFWTYGWNRRPTNYIRCRCIVCHKEFHTKSKDKSIPLQIEVQYSSESRGLPIQVKVSGKIIPFEAKRYDGRWWCYQCRRYHSY